MSHSPPKNVQLRDSHVCGEGGNYEGVTGRDYVRKWVRYEVGMKTEGMGHLRCSGMFSLEGKT